MALFETHCYMITSINTITTDFHYYITTYYSISTLMHLPNLEKDMPERTTFLPKGSAEDTHLKAWIKCMQRTGSERLFPNIITEANVNESMRILLRDRVWNGTRLTLSVVWDHVRSAYQTSSGAGVENVDAAIQLLTDAKPARVLMSQARQPFSDRNGHESPAQGGRNVTKGIRRRNGLGGVAPRSG